ncbi:MAG: PAS domain-containing sensor histidine kinase [Ignavibacteriales bacterium]|nr:PAS domain-containing sensor histidine kinase [Ignavibacteriales bacterium]
MPNNNPLVIVDQRMNIAYCNDAFKKTFSLDVHDDISKMNSNPEFVYFLKGFSESRYKNISLEINLSSDNNQFTKNYSVSIERVFISSGLYYVLTIESLAQRKKLENKINSLHNALDHGNVPIIILDASGKITYATRSFEVLLLREIESIYNRNLTEVLSDIFDKSEINHLEYALRSFIPWKKVIPFLARIPVTFWEFTLSPVLSNDELQQSFIFIANNLTEHINQTKAIERSERKQRLIINNISDLLLIIEHIGPAALFENANDNFCRIFNLDKNKIYSLKIDDFIPANLVDKIYQSMKHLSNSNLPFYEFNYKNFDKRDYSCKINSITEQERNSTIYIITMKDITDEVLYQDQLKRAYRKEMLLNQMKSDFLANMSHEIRTPFNAVVGFSEIVDESIETGNIEMLRDLMDSMKEVLGRGLNLFTNIVEVSQLEAGEVELDKVDLNCNQVVRNVYNKMLAETSKKNIEFVLEVDEEDCVIEVDWVKFEKIIHSLVDNAIKYTTHGCVYLSTKHFENSVEIVVSDTGVGIDKLHIERILKPFTQEVEGYTRPFEGAGLGLTIAFKLTKLMDGQFDIESEKNVGTKISISFAASK